MRDYEARALKISAQKAAYEHDSETAIALFTQSRDIAQIISHKLLKLFIELAAATLALRLRIIFHIGPSDRLNNPN